MVFLIVYSAMLAGLMVRVKSIRLRGVGDLPLVGALRKVFLGLQFFNLGGVPPLVGFLVKLMILKSMFFIGGTVIIIMVILSIIVLFIYTRTFLQAYCVSPEYLSGRLKAGSNPCLLLVTRIISLTRVLGWLAT